MSEHWALIFLELMTSVVVCFNSTFKRCGNTHTEVGSYRPLTKAADVLLVRLSSTTGDCSDDPAEEPMCFFKQVRIS